MLNVSATGDCAIARWNKPWANGLASRFAEDRHAAGLASESRDVVLHPSKRANQVESAEIAGAFLGRDVAGFLQCRVGEPAQHAEPVVDGDDHQAVMRRVVARRVIGRGSAD